jgi:hypothetical protein
MSGLKNSPFGKRLRQPNTNTNTASASASGTAPVHSASASSSRYDIESDDGEDEDGRRTRARTGGNIGTNIFGLGEASTSSLSSYPAHPHARDRSESPVRLGRSNYIGSFSHNRNGESKLRTRGTPTRSMSPNRSRPSSPAVFEPNPSSSTRDMSPRRTHDRYDRSRERSHERSYGNRFVPSRELSAPDSRLGFNLLDEGPSTPRRVAHSAESDALKGMLNSRPCYV